MSLDLRAMGQLSLLEQGPWRTMISLKPDHKLVVLCKAIPWDDLIENSIPILYQEQGIFIDVGRRLNLRAHLGIYILQSVYGWTDRWSEEMLRFYVPARLFCGLLDSTETLDRTSIEDFRNRFGEKGAELITGDMLKVAKEFGFTEPTDVDMDTTAQEAGITHPTEMKLLSRLMKKASTIHKSLKRFGKKGLGAMKAIAKEFSKLETNYRFYAKTKEKKDQIIRQSVVLSENILNELSRLVPGKKDFESLHHRYQMDILKLLDLGPRLLEQILYWLDTGHVAKDKIISLWKMMPTAIKKGKIGKPVEFGRKWVINAYRGGYVLLMAPADPKTSDQNCVWHSLDLHHKTVFGTHWIFITKLCLALTGSSSQNIRPSPKNLRRRSWHVGSAQSGTMYECGDQKNWHTTQRKGRSISQPKRAPPIIQSQSWHRSSNCALKDKGSWKKPDEKRCWRFNIRIPVCDLLQLPSFNARFDPATCSCYAATAIARKNKTKKSKFPQRLC